MTWTPNCDASSATPRRTCGARSSSGRGARTVPRSAGRHRGPAALLAVIVTIALVALLTACPAPLPCDPSRRRRVRAPETFWCRIVQTSPHAGRRCGPLTRTAPVVTPSSPTAAPSTTRARCGLRTALASRSCAELAGRRRGIWVMNADGTQARQLAADLRVARGLDWSPDGTSIAFTSTGSSDGTSSAQSVDLVNVESGTVTTLASGDYLGPSFSPDGRQIAMLQGFRPGLETTPRSQS